MKRISAMVLGGALVLLAVQPAIGATTASQVSISAQTLVFTAAMDVANAVSVQPGAAAGSYDVTDTAGVSTGAGCSAVSPTAATCTGDVRSFTVLVRNLDDQVTIGTLVDVHGSSLFGSIEGGVGSDTIVSATGALVHGNGGNDTIRAPGTLFGDDGNDSLTGGNVRDFLNGGNGNDHLDGQNGTDTLDGGLGSDQLDGGRGPYDLVTYAGRTQDLHISNDGVANDGAADENDNVINGEFLEGGDGNDTMVGVAEAKLYGNGGDDHMTFEAGGSGTLLGGPGDDTLTAAGTALAALRGQTGNDTIMSKNGHFDQVACAAGVDTVTADVADYIAADCEHVTQS